jgi:hypothetical protein
MGFFTDGCGIGIGNGLDEDRITMMGRKLLEYGE